MLKDVSLFTLCTIRLHVASLKVIRTPLMVNRDFGYTTKKEIVFIILIFVVLFFCFQNIVSKSVIKTNPVKVDSQPPAGFEKHQDFMSHPEDSDQKVNELAKKTGGDFTKLSGSDQEWLDAMTGGHGAAFLKGRADKVVLKTHRGSKS